MTNLCYMSILFLSAFNIAKIETNQDVDDTLVLWYPLPIKSSQIKSHNRTSLQKLLTPYLLHWHDLQDNEKCKQHQPNHVPVLNKNGFLTDTQSLLKSLLEPYNHKKASRNHTSIDLAAPNKQVSSPSYFYGNHEKDDSHKDESTINNEETEENVTATSDEDTDTSTTNADFSLETSTSSFQTENSHTTVEINNRIFIQNSTSSNSNSETITKRTNTESNLGESTEDLTNSQQIETTQSLNQQEIVTVAENDTVTDSPEDYEIWTEIYHTNADYLNLENSTKDHEDNISHENTATHEDTTSHTNTASLEDILSHEDAASPEDASNGEDTTSENSASLEDTTNNENTSTDTSVTLTNKDEEIQSKSTVNSKPLSSEEGTSFSSEESTSCSSEESTSCSSEESTNSSFESTTEHIISTDSIIDKRLLDPHVNNENDEAEEDIVAEETITERSIVNENKPLPLLIEEYLKSQNISEDVSLSERNKPCKCLYLITKLLIRDYLLHNMPTDVTNNN